MELKPNRSSVDIKLLTPMDLSFNYMAIPDGRMNKDMRDVIFNVLFRENISSNEPFFGHQKSGRQVR